MSPLTLVLTILQLLTDLFLIAVVMLQSGKSAGITGVISAARTPFFPKARPRR